MKNLVGYYLVNSSLQIDDQFHYLNKFKIEIIVLKIPKDNYNKM